MNVNPNPIPRIQINGYNQIGESKVGLRKPTQTINNKSVKPNIRCPSNKKNFQSTKAITSISEQIWNSNNLEVLDNCYTKYYNKFTDTTWSIFFHKISLLLDTSEIINEKELKIVAWRNITYLQKAAEFKVQFQNKDQNCLCKVYSFAVTILYNDTKSVDSILRIIRTPNELSLGDGYIPPKKTS